MLAAKLIADVDEVREQIGTHGKTLIKQAEKDHLAVGSRGVQGAGRNRCDLPSGRETDCSALIAAGHLRQRYGASGVWRGGAPGRSGGGPGYVAPGGGAKG